ncbi:MAG TPA: aconitate hydratase [bacterium]|nr:aconitate hydratase [bacterium]
MGETLTRKILKAHLVDGRLAAGEEIGIRVDEILIQDITGTAAVLHFEAMALERIRCKIACVYGDHNVLQVSEENTEDHVYLSTAARRYGMWWGKPGAGIGHQIHQEHFACPGDTALGADSHTPHIGGMGVYAMGAGGLDVAVAMGGGPYYFDTPSVVRVQLTGALRPWSTAKDVILEMLRRKTAKGGFGKVFEYVGPGIQHLNVQQRITICNMGAELGATTSVFPSDGVTRDYMRRIGREKDWREMLPDPDAGYDESMEIDLGTIEPLVALPSNPDKVVPISQAEGVKVDQVMVGSCTNGSYMDLQAVAKIVRGRKVHPDVTFFIHPSSRLDLELLAREGLLTDLIAAGVNVEAATCGACIGVGHVPAKGMKALRAINRNFKGRTGQKDDEVYLASSEVAAATAIAGVITDPRKLGIPAPGQHEPAGIDQDNSSLVPPAPEAEAPKVRVVKGDNIQVIPLKGALEATLRGEVLIALGDNISTDHIMPAGSQILRYRSNIPKLSDYVFNRVDPEFPTRAKAKKGGFIVGGSNYGQGSSREHAAIAPMYLGVVGVIVKDFARIHLANLINWGIVPMTFVDPADHGRVRQGDVLEVPGLRRQVESGADTVQVKNVTQGTAFPVALNLNTRERGYLLAGGKLAYTKAHPIH